MNILIMALNDIMNTNANTNCFEKTEVRWDFFYFIAPNDCVNTPFNINAYEYES